VYQSLDSPAEAFKKHSYVCWRTLSSGKRGLSTCASSADLASRFGRKPKSTSTFSFREASDGVEMTSVGSQTFCRASMVVSGMLIERRRARSMERGTEGATVGAGEATAV
jgi:hypothetical protein